MKQQQAAAVEPLREHLRRYIHVTKQEGHRRRYHSLPWRVLLLLGLLLLTATILWPVFVIALLFFLATALNFAATRTKVTPEWVRNGTQVQAELSKVPKELLSELFELGRTLETLPRLRESRSRTDPNVSRANRLVFEIQEALFVTLTHLLAYRTPSELMQLDESQRAFLRRAIFRTADASFIACAFLVLATLQDSQLRTHAEDLAAHHPSERIREAASEYLHALTTSLAFRV
ncbi:hypothetical protein [Armatimonas sp.]|uniref:hypothetical protein n=1 Tax=Armatimonas sp. TaxID=1872638 RepID=UPI00286B66C2|nr:hypothetical protein [Armatimonas sp.]